LGLDVTVDLIDEENIAHLLDTENQRTIKCIAATRESRPGTARHYGDPMLVRGFHNCGYLFCGAWEDHSYRLTSRSSGGSITLVGGEPIGVRHHVAISQGHSTGR
jgi:hypothetical protein